MTLFEKKLEKYLTIYKVPLKPNQLDPGVFYFPEDMLEPVLHSSILSQISKDIDLIVDGQPQRVKKCYLSGLVVNPNSKNRSGELKVIIVLNKDIMDVDIDGLAAEALLNVCKRLSGNLAVGTTRPIRYGITVRDIEPADHKGLYDIFENKWTKVPDGLTN